MAKCPHCGYELKPGAIRCIKCNEYVKSKFEEEHDYSSQNEIVDNIQKYREEESIPEYKEISDKAYRVNLPIYLKQFSIPFKCACCGTSTNLQSINLAYVTRSASYETTHQLKWPYCKHCIEHVNRSHESSNTSHILYVVGSLIVFFIAIGILYNQDNIFVPPLNILFGFGILCLLIYGWVKYIRNNINVAKNMMKPTCSSYDWAVMMDGGIFTFKNKNIAKEFASSNGGKIEEINKKIL